MKILGNQNSFRQKTFFIQDGQPPKNLSQQNIEKTQQDNSYLCKRKSITTKSKRSLGYNSGVQEFKQNQMKEKVFKQLQQLDKLNSNMNLLIVPFSLNNKNLDDSPMFVKSKSKNHHSQASHVAGRFTPYNQIKEQGNKEIQKVLENKLSNFAENKIQNKRKSVSYRIHIPPKQFNPNQQSKRNIQQLPPDFQKYDHRRRADNQTQIEKRIPLINKQKSSQSFIIRKKFNSNVVEVHKPQPQKPSNRFTYVMQKYRKDRFAKEENIPNLVEMTNQQIIQKIQSSASPKNFSTPFGSRTKEIVRNIRKQTGKKEHHLKGGKSLKVRVNKLIKAQQNFFNDKTSGDSRIKQNSQNQETKLKTQETQPRKQKIRYHTQEQIELQVLQKPVKIAQSPLRLEDDVFQNFKQDNSIIIDELDAKKEKTESSIEIIKSSSNTDSEKKIIIQSKDYLKVNNERQEENHSNIKNRKNRIASIRAIKNYYKKLDTQEKSCATDSKEPKQYGTVKKKQKQPPCLTHKIKWGNLSKKKLNSDRVFDVSVNPFTNECSVDGKMKVKKQNYEKESRIQQDENEQKNTIEAQLQDPKTKKKPFIRIAFAQDQGQTAKVGSSDEQIPHKNSNKNKNIEKNFAQTIKSKQFLDGDYYLQRPGSKSLIIFEDPGISLIANNNDSIHIADTRLILPSMDRLSIKALEMIDKDMISPVAVIKRRKQDGIEERMESLQELYFELKSHNSIPLKTNQEPRIQSIEELCQK